MGVKHQLTYLLTLQIQTCTNYDLSGFGFLVYPDLVHNLTVVLCVVCVCVYVCKAEEVKKSENTCPFM